MGRMNRTLNHYEQYEIIFEPKRIKSYEYNLSTGEKYDYPVYPISSINGIVSHPALLTPEKYAAIRSLLCRYIGWPALYDWKHYQLFMDGRSWYEKEPNQYQLKMFRKGCQRLINQLDENFKMLYKRVN